MEKITQIKTGYLYHIKDEYFNKINDENVMQNHEKGKNDQLILLLKMAKFYGLFQSVQK